MGNLATRRLYISYSFMPPLTNRFRRCFALFQRVTYASLPLVVGKEIATTAEPLPEGGKRQVHTAKARSLITTRRISANRDDPRRSFWMVHTKKILLKDGFVFCFNEAYQPKRFRFSPTLFYCSKPFLKKTFQPHRRPHQRPAAVSCHWWCTNILRLWTPT